MPGASGERFAAPGGKLTLDEALSSARETRALVIGSDVLRDAPTLFAQQFPGCSAVIVADERTFAAAGRVVSEAFAAERVRSLAPYIFRDPSLYAEMRFVNELECSLAGHDAIPVAVGSGTINDLTKLAAYRIRRPGYMCVATAASMDGYTAFGASIAHRGAKQTFECPAPVAVLADIDVIRTAPQEMTASGYADLAAKITAGADWIIADALEVEPIDSHAWTIVQGRLRDLLADPAGARQGSPAAVAPLVEGLMLGGFAMQWSKSSRPASGAEHQFSHLWDMEHHLHQGETPPHGFKVGIATLAITRFYEQLLEHDFRELDIDACVASWPDQNAIEAEVRERFSKAEFIDTAVSETRAKQVHVADLRHQLQLLKTRWPEIRTRLREQLLPSAEIGLRLNLVGAPTEPEQIGISSKRLRETFRRAYHIRRRFTVLDLAKRTGLMETFLAGLFDSGAPREISPMDVAP